MSCLAQREDWFALSDNGLEVRGSAAVNRKGGCCGMAQTTPSLRTRLTFCAFGILSAVALVVLAREEVRRAQPPVQIARANMDPETTGSIRRRIA